MIQIKNFSQFIQEKRLTRSAGLAIVCHGKLLMAHTTGRKISGGWGIPKGGIEVGESALDAAIREVAEETGIRVNKQQVDPIAHQFIVNSKYGGKLVEYFIVPIQTLDEIGMRSDQVPKSWLQLDEVDFAQFFDFKQASRLVMASQKSMLMNLNHMGLMG